MKYFPSAFIASLTCFTFTQISLSAAPCSITDETTYNTSLATPSGCIDSTNATLSVQNSFSLSADAATITDASNPILINSTGPVTISGGGFGLLNTNTPNVSVSLGSNVSYSNGTMNFQAGSLTFSNSTNWTNGGSGITNISLGTSSLLFSTSGTISSTFTLSGAPIVSVDSTNSVIQTGVISGTGSLTKSGTGTLTLSGTNTYSGGTTLTAGTISLQNTSGLGTLPLSMSDGTTLVLGNISMPNAIDLNGSNTISIPNVLTY